MLEIRAEHAERGERRPALGKKKSVASSGAWPSAAVQMLRRSESRGGSAAAGDGASRAASYGTAFGFAAVASSDGNFGAMHGRNICASSAKDAGTVPGGGICVAPGRDSGTASDNAVCAASIRDAGAAPGRDVGAAPDLGRAACVWNPTPGTDAPPCSYDVKPGSCSCAAPGEAAVFAWDSRAKTLPVNAGSVSEFSGFCMSSGFVSPCAAFGKAGFCAVSGSRAALASASAGLSGTCAVAPAGTADVSAASCTDRTPCGTSAKAASALSRSCRSAYAAAPRQSGRPWG